jgi:hypothetical protein
VLCVTTLSILVALAVDVSRSGAARVVLVPVRTYLATHAEGLPVTPEALFPVWLICGGVLIVISLAGVVAARVGWILFGVGTGAMVWQATPAPSTWVAVGITAAWWSALSLFVFRRTGEIDDVPESEPGLIHELRSVLGRGLLGRLFAWPIGGPLDMPSGRPVGGSRAAEARGAAWQRRVDDTVRKLCYQDAPAYHKAHCTTAARTLAEDLQVPASFITELRQAYFPPVDGDRTRVPRQIQHEAARTYLAGGRTLVDIARSYGINASTLSRWVKHYKLRTQAEGQGG